MSNEGELDLRPIVRRDDRFFYELTICKGAIPDQHRVECYAGRLGHSVAGAFFVVYPIYFDTIQEAIACYQDVRDRFESYLTEAML